MREEHKNLGLGVEGAVTPSNQIAAARDEAATARDPSLGTKVLLEMGSPSSKSPFVLPGQWLRPCTGQAPLNLDSHQPTYRDCSPPDPGQLNREKRIERPAEGERPEERPVPRGP